MKVGDTVRILDKDSVMPLLVGATGTIYHMKSVAIFPILVKIKDIYSPNSDTKMYKNPNMPGYICYPVTKDEIALLRTAKNWFGEEEDHVV